MAALSAIDMGRKYAFKLSTSLKEAPARQMSIREAWGQGDPPPAPYVRAGRAAVVQFWTLLQDFAVLHEWPHKWADGQKLPFDHAFLGANPRVPARNGVRAIHVVPRVYLV